MHKKYLLIATHNQAKLEEMRKLLVDFPYHLISLNDLTITHDVEETGTTFAENAALKAVTYARLSGLPALGDDGGLEVAALNGEPGVYSARYAGLGATDEQKVAYLLQKMKHIGIDERQAKFTNVLALASTDGVVSFYEGSIDGSVSLEARGTLVKGFPYRQIFVLSGYDKTLSELDEKNIVYESHRHRALKKLFEDKNSI